MSNSAIIAMVLSLGSAATAAVSDDAKSVIKIRDCGIRSECQTPPVNRGRIDVESSRLRFLDAQGRAIRERPLHDSDSGEGFKEDAFTLAGDVGVVVRKWKPLHEGMESVSHEILSLDGSLIASISGEEVPEVVRPAPDLSYYLGWSSHMGSEGEPFVFFDSTGRLAARIDGIFCTAGTSQCGGGVKISFSPTAKLVAISVEGRGLAVFNSDGSLRWKKSILGWSGGAPQFFPSGDRFIIAGRVIHVDPDPRIKDGTLGWEEVVDLPIEERQRLLAPKGVQHGESKLYCYSSNHDAEIWHSRDWAGQLLSTHRTTSP